MRTEGTEVTWHLCYNQAVVEKRDTASQVTSKLTNSLMVALCEFDDDQIFSYLVKHRWLKIG